MINQQTELKPDSPSKISRSVWFDLPVSNLGDAMSFYEGLLGWKYQQMENSPLSDYVMIDVGGTLIGGIRQVLKKSNSHAEYAGPILYFTVDKLAPKVARAKELGAEIVGLTVELGNDRGRYQWIRDREGNLIGLWGAGMKPDRRSAVLIALALGAALLSGCANVKPWQRDILARPAMQLDPNPLISGCDDHIYFSREASKGGRGYGGGGCGCN